MKDGLSTGPSFRPARATDVAACVAILIGWVEEAPWMHALDDRPTLETYWRSVFERDRAWVAVRNDRIIGFCTRDEDNIGALYVAPDERNAGVGKHLLDLAKADREWITVWAYEKNPRARDFYRREGLIEVGREVDEMGLMDIEHRWTRSG